MEYVPDKHCWASQQWHPTTSNSFFWLLNILKATRYPHKRSLGNDDDIEEERRVLYVALKRAENELILTRAGNPGQTTIFGGSGLGDRDHVNYFFSDVPKELVESSFIEGDDHSTFLDGLKEFEKE